MARRLVDIYFDVDQGILLNSSGGPAGESQIPRIYYQEEPLFLIRFVKGSLTAPYTGLSVSQTFGAAIASDWSHATAPMCRTLHADINVAGDWAEADLTQGKMSIRLNARTEEYRNVIDGVSNVSAWFEFKAYDSEGDLQVVFMFNLFAYNLLDPLSSAEPVIEGWTAFDARYVQRNFAGANHRIKSDGTAIQIWDADMGKWRSILISGGALSLTTEGED